MNDSSHIRAGAPNVAAWFTRVGLPLPPAEIDTLDAVLRRQGLLLGAAIEAIERWSMAAAFVRASERDCAWWDQEEAERERLWEIAAATHGESALLEALDAVREDVAATVQKAAREAMARAGVEDPELLREAVAATLLAAHQDALTRLAGEGGDHFFAIKYRLFVAGRWPLGLQGGRFGVF